MKISIDRLKTQIYYKNKIKDNLNYILQDNKLKQEEINNITQDILTIELDLFIYNNLLNYLQNNKYIPFEEMLQLDSKG